MKDYVHLSSLGRWRYPKDRKRRPQPNLDIFYFSESRIQLASHIISMIFCAILLLRAMAVLSILNNRSWKMRLDMVALFTVLFAGVVGLLTNARRAEIFASSAAYAAVLVVYVSGTLGPPVNSGWEVVWCAVTWDPRQFPFHIENGHLILITQLYDCLVGETLKSYVKDNALHGYYCWTQI